jgi:hypothetical protein
MLVAPFRKQADLGLVLVTQMILPLFRDDLAW